MKKQIILFLLFSNLCLAQKDVIGLFEKCDSDISGYVCQQVLFKENKTFVFYDLLHLRGWTLSDGFWELKDDTVILKSAKPAFAIEYKGTSYSDSITIYVSDSVESLPFANITINSHQLSSGLSGTIKYPRQQMDTLYISCINTYSGQIIVDKEKIKNIDTLIVNLNMDFSGKYHFNNEKWLLKNKKLYHTQDSVGNFCSDKYFNKVKLKELKYRKDY